MFIRSTFKLALIQDFNTAKGLLSIPQSQLMLPFISQTQRHFAENKKPSHESQLMVHSYFNFQNKNKETFIEAIHKYCERERLLRGHVEFIYGCLKYMEEFGVHKDLEVYKAILDIMPKGKMIPNRIQQMFYHYPKHQECAVDVLEKMEKNGVIPDDEVRQILFNTFGKLGQPTLKFARMMYWMPKFKYASPWPLPDTLPNDTLELAKLALLQMNSVDPASVITVLETKDVAESIEDTWVVSAISSSQHELIAKHDKKQPLKVEGPFGLYLRDQRIAYFVLRGDPKPVPRRPKRSEIDDVRSIFVWMAEEGKPQDWELIKACTVHEQEDSLILAMCATGTSSRDSVLSWIRLLEKSVPDLSGIPILFTQSSPIGDIIVFSEEMVSHPTPDGGGPLPTADTPTTAT